ncbi:MAG: PAS domain S-box protein [Candidatus Methylomirabilales bacterium]
MNPRPDTRAQDAIAAESARLFEEMESTNRRLFALNRVAQTVNQSLNLQEVLEAALDATLKAVEVEGGNIRLWDEQQGVLAMAAHRGMSEWYINERRNFKPGEGVGGKVFQRGETFLVEDMAQYPHLNEMAQRDGVRSVASIPIRSRDKMVGVMSILSHGQRRFTPPEIDLLTAIGNQIGTALENARLFEQIAQGKREWESTFDAIADGIVLLDERGTVVRANRAFGGWWDSPTARLIGTSWHTLWDRLGLSAPCPHCQVLDRKEPVAAEADVPGSQRFLALAAFPLQPEDPMLWAPITGTIIAIRDVTERKQAEAAVRETKAFYERLVGEAGDAIVVLDRAGTILTWNTGAERLFGWTAQEALGHSYLALQGPDVSDEIMENLHQSFAGHSMSNIEMRRRRKDGTWFDGLLTVSPVRDASGEVIAIQGIVRDITERKRAEETLRRAHDELERGVQERTAELSKAIDFLQEQIAERQRVEEELRRSEDQLRALSGHLRAAQEEERARIAREVHDELGQALTALKIDLAWVGQRLADEQKELQTKVQLMTHLIDETVQAVRRIATELRPGVLDHLGLVPALEWQVREFQERTGLACVFKKSPTNLVVDAARATTVFRICQEALTNVARHAHATSVDINLRMAGRKLVLKVRDNGRGISADAVADPQSVGLMGMRERVLPWGGDVWIHGTEGKGTVVTVHLPAGKGDPRQSGDRS